MSEPGAGLTDRTVGLVRALRAAEVPVSLAETIDAVRALTVVDLLDRDVLHAGLSAASVKKAAHQPTFDVLFDLWFPRGAPREPDDQASAADPPVGTPGAPSAELTDGSDGDRGPLPADREAWRAELTRLLLADDAASLRRFASDAVGALGRADVQPGRQAYFAYRVLRELSPDTLLATLIQALTAGEGLDRSPFDEEVARRTARSRVRAFTDLVDAEVRRRLAEDRDRESVARTALQPLVEHIDFLRASRADLDLLRHQVQPLARRLATRLAARRRTGRAGRLDVRRTVRTSLATGGVPLVTRHRPRRPHKPELVVLCDLSGSVAAFAQFTMMLTWALQEQFSKIRVFAFIDTCDEVSRFLQGADDLPAALARMSREAELVWFDGHSDYGHSFEVFADRYASAITPRTSLLVLGDARTNYRDPSLAVLGRLVAEARHAFWLNPEPRGQWGSGDSAALRYADVVEMVECRTVAQLERFVTRLLPA